MNTEIIVELKNFLQQNLKLDEDDADQLTMEVMQIVEPKDNQAQPPQEYLKPWSLKSFVDSYGNYIIHYTLTKAALRDIDVMSEHVSRNAWFYRSRCKKLLLKITHKIKKEHTRARGYDMTHLTGTQTFYNYYQAP